MEPDLVHHPTSQHIIQIAHGSISRGARSPPTYVPHIHGGSPESNAPVRGTWYWRYCMILDSILCVSRHYSLGPLTHYFQLLELGLRQLDGIALLEICPGGCSMRLSCLTPCPVICSASAWNSFCAAGLIPSRAATIHSCAALLHWMDFLACP